MESILQAVHGARDLKSHKPLAELSGYIYRCAKFNILTISSVCILVVYLSACIQSQVGIFNRVSGGFLLISAAAFSFLVAWQLLSSLAGPLERSCGKVRARLLVVSGASFVILLYGFVFYHPSERITGSSDEGLYVSAAANLARTGHYYLDAPILQDLSFEEKALLFREEPAAAQRGTKMEQVQPRYHIGLFLREPEGTQLTPQFPLGWPTVLASVYSWGGMQGLQLTNPWILFTSAVLFGSLVFAWFCSVTAICATLIFLFFPLSLWFGRSFFSEPLFQCFWLLALLGCNQRKEAPITAGIICGLALGSLLYIKIEGFAAVVVLLCLVSWYWRTARSFAMAAALSGMIATGCALLALQQFNSFYLRDTFGTVPARYLWTLAAGVLLIPAFFSARPVREFLSAGLQPSSQWRFAAFWFLLGLAFYAAIFRTESTPFDTYFYWPLQQEIRSFREHTFLRLGWYWQYWGLAVATVGAAWLVFQLRRPWQVAFFAFGLVALVGLSYDIRNNPIQPYAMRRLMPIAMPLLFVGAAVIGRPLSARFLSRWPKIPPAALQFVLTASLLVGFYPINQTLNRHAEFSGAWKQIENLSNKLPENAILVVSEGSLLSWMATPLQFIFDRQALIIPPKAFADSNFISITRRWKDAARPVYLLTEYPGVRWMVDADDSQVMNPTHFDDFRVRYLYQSPVISPEKIASMDIRYYLIPLQEW